MLPTPSTPTALILLLATGCSTEPALVQATADPADSAMVDPATLRPSPLRLPPIDREVQELYGPGKYETATFALG